MGNMIVLSEIETAIKEMTDKRDGWGDRVAGFSKTIKEICEHYAEFLKTSPLKIFEALEKERDYSYPNYYQEAKFPRLDNGVRVFQTRDEMLATINLEKGFRCPSCGGISKNYQTCDTGIKREDGTICDWKAWGLFGTMGQGLRLMIVEGFLENAIVYEIFYPVAMENLTASNHC